MDVTLREITMDNVIECVKLTVRDTQTGYIVTNVFSRAALRQVTNRFKGISACREIQTSYGPGNTAAKHLDTDLGFRQTGEETDGGTIVRMSPTQGG